MASMESGNPDFRYPFPRTEEQGKENAKRNKEQQDKLDEQRRAERYAAVTKSTEGKTSA